jgi:hypothetical protein
MAHTGLRFSASALVAVIALCAAVPAVAGPDNLREGLFGDRPPPGHSTAPPVARYVSEGGMSFVLDRSQPRPLLKFDDNPEVWALRAQPGPRGDVIYKNDLGEPVIRATRLGGLTIFTDLRPSGSPAALAGMGPPIRMPAIGPQVLLERLAQASARATRAARRLIPFEADASPESSAIVADAAMVAAQAVVRISRRADARDLLGRITRVHLVEGEVSEARVSQGVIRITVTVEDGLAGRPSSDRIMAALGAQ